VRQTIDLTGLHLTRARLGDANLTSARLNDAVWPSEAAVPEGWEREADGRLHRSSTSWDGQWEPVIDPGPNRRCVTWCTGPARP
jgi:hypothetical protein